MFLKDVSLVVMQKLVEYMYQGAATVDEDILADFIRTSEALKIKGLSQNDRSSPISQSTMPTKDFQMEPSTVLKENLPNKKTPKPTNVVRNQLTHNTQQQKQQQQQKVVNVGDNNEMWPKVSSANSIQSHDKRQEVIDVTNRSELWSQVSRPSSVITVKNHDKQTSPQRTIQKRCQYNTTDDNEPQQKRMMLPPEISLALKQLTSYMKKPDISTNENLNQQESHSNDKFGTSNDGYQYSDSPIDGLDGSTLILNNGGQLRRINFTNKLHYSIIINIFFKFSYLHFKTTSRMAKPNSTNQF